MGITRNINKIKNQLESANEKIESFKDSMSTIQGMEKVNIGDQERNSKLQKAVKKLDIRQTLS